MKKSIKIFLIFLVLINVVFLNIAFASSTETTKENQDGSKYVEWKSFSDEVNNGTWLNREEGDVVDVSKTVMGTIITVMRVVGTGVAIIMLTYVAIKYMSAAPQEKADFKKSATAYIVGAVVLFGATGILGIISDFATKTMPTEVIVQQNNDDKKEE